MDNRDERNKNPSGMKTFVGGLPCGGDARSKFVERLVAIPRWIPKLRLANFDWNIDEVRAGVENDEAI